MSKNVRMTTTLKIFVPVSAKSKQEKMRKAVNCVVTSTSERKFLYRLPMSVTAYLGEDRQRP